MMYSPLISSTHTPDLRYPSLTHPPILSHTHPLRLLTRPPSLTFTGKGDSGTIAERVEKIQEEISETTSDYEREKLEERLAKLSDGVAVLKVNVC